MSPSPQLCSSTPELFFVMNAFYLGPHSGPLAPGIDAGQALVNHAKVSFTIWIELTPLCLSEICS
jgi:hypothetical protein